MSTSANTDLQDAQNVERQHRKFLTFFLGDEEYGIEIERVNEIIGVMPITPLPAVPDFICGVINLRGRVIPVLSLRRKLGLEAVEDTRETCIIIVRENTALKGIIVDRVSEVLDIVAEAIDEVPELGQAVNTELLLGIGRVEGKVKLLLNIDASLAMDHATEIMLNSSSQG